MRIITYREIREALTRWAKSQSEHRGVRFPLKLITEDAEVVVTAVNEGIDAYLEACYVPSRGDRYGLRRKGVGGLSLNAMISADSLPVLLRRLMTMDSGEDLSSCPGSLAVGMLYAIGLDTPGIGEFQIVAPVDEDPPDFSSPDPHFLQLGKTVLLIDLK